MFIVLSPSKKLEENPRTIHDFTYPEFIDQASTLIAHLKQKSQEDVAKLMNLSDNLARLNVDRYQAFQAPFTKDNATPALWTFKGDVYDGLNAANFSGDDVAFAQKYLRILSGLYGLMRPTDLMQAYRLEMGVKFSGSWGKHLYDFWSDQLTEALNLHMRQAGDGVLINLASNEYFKVLNPKNLDAKVITINFKEFKNGAYKSLMLYVKRARGMMARYIIEHKLTKVEDVKSFNLDRYRFEPAMSDEAQWMFVR